MASSTVTTDKDDLARLPEAVGFFSIFNLFIFSTWNNWFCSNQNYNANIKQNCSDRCDRISLQYFVNKNDPTQPRLGSCNPPVQRGPERVVRVGVEGRVQSVTIINIIVHLTLNKEQKHTAVIMFECNDSIVEQGHSHNQASD